MMNSRKLLYNVFMDGFEFEDFIDRGCPSCGASAGEDCADNCLPMDVPPSMYAMLEEQMEYVAHKVYQDLIGKFKKKLLTEQVQVVMSEFGYLSGLCRALINAKVLNHSEQVLEFFENPNIYKRHYVVWNELGNPIDKSNETWSMFTEALINTEKDKSNGQQA